jgi:hypothetical protein
MDRSGFPLGSLGAVALVAIVGVAGMYFVSAAKDRQIAELQKELDAARAAQRTTEAAVKAAQEAVLARERWVAEKAIQEARAKADAEKARLAAEAAQPGGKR